jgi:hypothetical protein
MRLSATSQKIIASDSGILVLSALSVVALHTATNGEYGFHRDELATIDFFTVPTLRFQVLYVFLVLAHDRRRIVHFNHT